MPRDTKSLGPRLALATIAGVLLAIAGLLTFYGLTEGLRPGSNVF